MAVNDEVAWWKRTRVQHLLLLSLCRGVVPGAKARVESENGLLSVSVPYLALLPLESKEREVASPAAQGLAADTRMFFLACPIHVIFLACLSHKSLKDFPENLPD